MALRQVPSPAIGGSDNAAVNTSTVLAPSDNFNPTGYASLHAHTSVDLPVQVSLQDPR